MCHFKATHERFYSHDRYRRLYEDVVFPEPEDLHWDASPRDKVFEGWPLEIYMQRCLDHTDAYPPPELSVEGLDPHAARSATYQKLLHDYMRTVAGIDDNLARLLDYLDDAGLAEDTVVIYTSDQGYFLGEHNLFDKRFMLEESLRMPLVIRYPREIKPGTVNADIITNTTSPSSSSTTLAPRHRRRCRAAASAVTCAARRPMTGPTAMYYHYWTPDQPVRPSHYGIRTRDHKLIFYYGLVRDEGRRPEACWEFYDLTCDPHELRNRIADPAYAQTIGTLRDELEALRRHYGDTTDPVTSHPQGP